MNSMEVREYVVCYFDLLGQREGLLKRVRTEEPSEDLQKEIDSVSNLIVLFNESLRQSFDAIKNHGRDILRLMGIPETRMPPFLERMQQVHLGIQQFSDSTLFFAGANDGDGLGFGMFISFCLFFAAQYLYLISKGMLIRGAVTLGRGWEIAPNCLYGPVMEDVYSLESSAAHYPRVVVDRKVISRVLQLDKEAAATNITPKPSDYFVCDVDGIHVLDYLSLSAVKWFESMGASRKQLLDTLSNALGYLQTTLDSLLSTTTTDVSMEKKIQKYGYLRSYWTTRMDALIKYFQETDNPVVGLPDYSAVIQAISPQELKTPATDTQPRS